MPQNSAPGDAYALEMLLASAAEMAKRLDEVGSQERARLRTLAKDIKTSLDRDLPVKSQEAVAARKGRGARVYEANLASTEYLIILPPDSDLEPCDQCKGRRVVGSNKK